MIHYFRMIAFLVLNIIASIFAVLFLIVPESIGIAFSAEYPYHSSFNPGGNYGGSSYNPGKNPAGNSGEVINIFHLYCILFILGLVQTLTSIVAAGYSCSAVCCGQNQKNPGVVIYAPACNTNQSHLTPVALNVQATAPGNFVYVSNPITSTDSIFVDVPLNTQKATENEKNDQQGMYYVSSK